MKNFILLLYHGVTDYSGSGIQNCSHKHISLQKFEEQMRLLSEQFNVLSLNDLLRLKKKGKLPDKSVSVTFDDGFANNYTHAFPLLKKYGIPATFYLTTGFIDTNKVFWVDKIEYLLNETSESCIHLDSIDISLSLSTIQSKITALKAIKSCLKKDSKLIKPILQELEKKSNVPAKYNYDDYSMLTWDNVRTMDDSELCEFGAHTVDHSILSHLSREEKEFQISESKKKLEDELNHEITLFSYPEGQLHHYDSETIELLRRYGFSSSPTARFGINNQYISNFRLYRNMVEFDASFEKCLEGLS